MVAKRIAEKRSKALAKVKTSKPKVKKVPRKVDPKTAPATKATPVKKTAAPKKK